MESGVGVGKRVTSVDLDRVESYQPLDPGGMLKLVSGLSEQCRRAWEISSRVTLPAEYRNRENIVAFGMGGSAIGADLVRLLVAPEMGIPFLVVRGYDIPHYVSDKTLAIVSSYSGNTEETISAYEAARERGAKLVAITSGGRLAELSRKDGVPLIALPGGYSPRAALGYLFLAALSVVQKVGLIQDKSEDVEEACDVLEQLAEVLGPASPVDVNQSKRVALEMFGRVPVIYGPAGFPAGAALRWKCQVNENAKAQAFWNEVPEMNHNEIVGWGGDESIQKGLSVILLRDKGEHPRVARRLEIVKSLVKGASSVTEVQSIGRSELARLLSLIYVGDFASVYLAFLYGVDPTPVKVIDYLKLELGKES
ncbi:MAG TPA: bifunctional phosphoglucose/phosphomannose isomerase [Firmicutes bacterium]|nr:bifunctional phosphoglucose/phosphomannose isomerase [Bacillota bacterium]